MSDQGEWLVEAERVTRLEGEDDSPVLGAWYWYRDQPGDFHLLCVTHLGSNYAALAWTNDSITRVHLRDFNRRCVRETEPERVIAAEVGFRREALRQLMGEVREITSRLGLPVSSSDSEVGSQALVLSSGRDPGEYKESLVRAKKDTLPKLFEQIKRVNEGIGRWLSAPMLPHRATIDGLRPLTRAIEQRVFNIDLYAGLSETVERIRDGEPAPADTPISLFQRRHYMDEECLARYEAGGMRFANLGEFDRWMARPENFERLLPAPRCVVAFQVRRRNYEVGDGRYTLAQFFRILDLQEADRFTFLYIRNGDQLFRLSTKIEFREQLFPDGSRIDTNRRLFVHSFASSLDRKLTSESEYLETLRERREGVREARRKGKRYFGRGGTYIRYSPRSVYYDDIAEMVRGEMEEHNRLVVVLQGLLDRSEAFLPHPPWSLWTEDFDQAINLVYDQSRALTAGDPPDFEAYRARLNATITPESVTIGQHDAWVAVETRRENERSRSRRGDHPVDYYVPYGNPGPGLLARPVSVSPGGKCTFKWLRERVGGSWYDRKHRPSIPCSLTVSREGLFNVSAYRPGDYHIFFDDPRTRGDYLQWAPFLLVAEDYHAGKRGVGGKEQG